MHCPTTDTTTRNDVAMREQENLIDTSTRSYLGLPFLSRFVLSSDRIPTKLQQSQPTTVGPQRAHNSMWNFAKTDSGRLVATGATKPYRIVAVAASAPRCAPYLKPPSKQCRSSTPSITPPRRSRKPTKVLKIPERSGTMQRSRCQSPKTSILCWRTRPRPFQRRALVPLLIVVVVLAKLQHGKLIAAADVNGEPEDAMTLQQQQEAELLRRSESSSSSNARRYLQGLFPPFVTSLLEFAVPFYRPNEYNIHPVEAFNRYTVCTDIRLQRCTNDNVIRFTTNENPGPTEFRYHNTGPLQLQGVFWTKMLFSGTIFSSTDLLSFAPTRHGGGVATGRLETNADGFEYVIRPIGDHNWSRSSNFPSFYLAYYDALYLFDLTEGTLENPLSFVVSISFKLFFACLRFNFGRFGSVITGRYEMSLVTDPTDATQMDYPASYVWERKTSFALDLLSLTYHSIQIIDGNGNPIEPAYSDWLATSKTNYITGLREDSLNDIQVC